MSVDPDVIKAVSDPLRLRIVTLLAREALCTTHLWEETGTRRTDLSDHLRVLREAGAVETEPCGRFDYHRPRPQVPRTPATAFSTPARSATATAGDRRPC